MSSPPNFITIPAQSGAPYTYANYTLTSADIGKTLVVRTSNKDEQPGLSGFFVVFTIGEGFTPNSICYLKNIDLYENTIGVLYVQPNGQQAFAFYSPNLLPSEDAGRSRNASLMVLQCLFGNLLACF